MEISRAAYLVLAVLSVQGSIPSTLTLIVLSLCLPFLISTPSPLVICGGNRPLSLCLACFSYSFLCRLLSELPLPAPFLSNIPVGTGISLDRNSLCLGPVYKVPEHLKLSWDS